jgi:hypothetical protein
MRHPVWDELLNWMFVGRYSATVTLVAVAVRTGALVALEIMGRGWGWG